MFGLLHGRTRRNLCGDPPTECWRHQHGIQENPDEMFGSVNVLDVHPVHGPDQRMGRNGRSGTTPLMHEIDRPRFERRQLFFLRCRNWRTDSDAHVQLEQAETTRFDCIQRFSVDATQSEGPPAKTSKSSSESSSANVAPSSGLFSSYSFPCRSNRPESLKKDLPPGVGQSGLQRC